MQAPVVGVDHDSETDDTGVLCTNYAGLRFPLCYDGHKGTDLLLRKGFVTMDKYNVQVVAAASGKVVGTHDGEYDRCHADEGFEVSCDGHPMKANTVTIKHDDGTKTIYVHLMKGSVKVSKGDQVECGQLLGYVGSSGHSAMPHLHFQVETAEGKIIDPFSGIESQENSYWVQQVGQYGWPAELCAGDPIPVDAGPAADGGAVIVDAGSLDAASTTDGGNGGEGVGCSVSGSRDGFAMSLLMLLALWHIVRRKN